jgi:hypothetical protein
MGPSDVYIYIFFAALLLLPRRSPLLRYFSYLLQLLLGGFLVAAEVSQIALCHWPTHQQRERRLRWSKSRDNQQCDRLARSGSLLLHPLIKAVWSLTWLTSWELQILVKSVVNRFSWITPDIKFFRESCKHTSKQILNNWTYKLWATKYGIEGTFSFMKSSIIVPCSRRRRKDGWPT